MSARDDILARLRQARDAGALPPLPPRTSLPVTRLEDVHPATLQARFVAEVERVRGNVHAAADDEAARATLVALIRACGARRVAAWDDIGLSGWWPAVAALGAVRVGDGRSEAATAEVGVTGCDALIAATGTVALEAGPGRSRLASLMPPVHIVVGRERQLAPRLEDYFAAHREAGHLAFRRGSAVTLVTGPSRTADIEMQIVYGAHGPLQFHVILIAT